MLKTKPNQTTCSTSLLNNNMRHSLVLKTYGVYGEECCVQSWTSPGSNTPQDTNCTATCPLSRKLFKLDEPDMQDTAGEAEMNS